MIVQLRAEESLRRVAEIALGTGSLSKDDARRYHDALVGEAAGRTPTKIPTKDELLAFAAMSGMEAVKDGNGAR